MPWRAARRFPRISVRWHVKEMQRNYVVDRMPWVCGRRRRLRRGRDTCIVMLTLRVSRCVHWWSLQLLSVWWVCLTSSDLTFFFASLHSLLAVLVFSSLGFAIFTHMYFTETGIFQGQGKRPKIMFATLVFIFDSMLLQTNFLDRFFWGFLGNGNR